MAGGGPIAKSKRGLEDRDPFREGVTRFAAGRLGMWLFLLTLGILFASTILAYVVVRLEPENRAHWRGIDSPGIPLVLLVSTAVLMASSWTMHQGLSSIMLDQRGQGRQWVDRTLILGSLFLVLQVIGWSDMWRAGERITDSLYAWTFYVLTGLHALHVLGGLVPLALVAHRARQGTYSRISHNGLTYCAMYWHFLGGVWLVLYLSLWLGSR